MEWARPLRSGNLYDLQIVDLSDTYPFRLKVFLHQPDQPDLLSPVMQLEFHTDNGRS